MGSVLLHAKGFNINEKKQWKLNNRENLKKKVNYNSSVLKLQKGEFQVNNLTYVISEREQMPI